MRLYVDIPGNESTDASFTCGQRPDLVLATTSKLFILELAVCFETNLLKSRNYKKNRYAHLKENIIDKSKEVDLISYPRWDFIVWRLGT